MRRLQIMVQENGGIFKPAWELSRKKKQLGIPVILDIDGEETGDLKRKLERSTVYFKDKCKPQLLITLKN